MIHILLSILFSLTWIASGHAEDKGTGLSSGRFRESGEELDKNELWQSKGFRLDVGYFRGQHKGFSSAPSGTIQGVRFGLSTRFDERWSLMGALRYGGASDQLNGFVYSIATGPGIHWNWFTFGLIAGVTGLSEQPGARSSGDLERLSNLVSSYTLPEDGDPISACTGFGPLVGAVLHARYPLGAIFAVKLGARIELTRLTCELDTERVEPDTAEALTIRQLWSGWRWSMYGGLAWR